MLKKRIIILKTNTLDIDPRLEKEIATLDRAGYSVILICWDRNRNNSRFSQVARKNNYFQITMRLRAPFGVKILPLLPIWWCFVTFHLLKSKYEIIHAINFDSIIPAAIISKIKRKPIIYEMHDTYEDHILLPRWLRNIFVYIDKLVIKVVNFIIIVDESRIEEFNGIPNDNIAVIYNSPPDIQINEIAKEENKNTFSIFYAGSLSKGRSIEKVITAVHKIDNIEFVIAGFGDQEQMVQEEASKSLGKIRYIGKIPYDVVIEHTLTSNLLFSLYDPMIPLNKFASSNKLFEAMMSRKPVLVSKGTAMERIVKREKCGLIVDCNDPDEIRKAILYLMQNTDYCRLLGANGRKAYENIYNWKAMEERLLNIYRLLGV